ncbi:MAG: bifunctional glutamate N-acetyltransferase/amino-acid acetyltransferase ArgJ [Chloroflexi bacterium]|nr:bifunctional glutamate N-acetyltransferase/amino-acid acetyltransferase ArgJ [Chloroflexota bacterium]MCI0580977.1 bifunctional glutamate N-acetyltransferase/amino-acid acetyltransferase ArgJ [Chloroflexota bacterium]MCI0645351.1 bifunctional glutamate N-acetyltransferase/amino-acid acetyltransferase ArgJ [Chloroflexota bacterium]MCI0728478.1 bifunctional glutamate N-acetyltransferase/amino-acid acetyltransferase ArgJ [Chloroflexota bacterium]
MIEKVVSGGVTSAQGFRAAAVACGLKQSGKLDLAVVYSERECTAAGVFTRNQVAAAPVVLDRGVLAAGRDHIRGVVANAGNANACTGAGGLAAARAVQQAAAVALGCRPEQLFVLSTGVIGVPLPVDKIEAGLRIVSKGLSPDNGAAAQAIMTTDTRPKQLAVRVALPGGTVTVGGMAKGAGMIHPDMATMLAVLTTDAAVPAGSLQALLHQAVDQSFNCISVDGDTSTNDTVLLLANGASGVAVENEAALAHLAEGLNAVCTELARLIVADGEGASKFVEIQVSGASGVGKARAVAATIATSPLVKTALAGGDPNWGRILAAAGRAGVQLDAGRLALWVSNPGAPALQLVKEGASTGYVEADAAAVFARPEIVIRLDLGQGQAQATMWTCDLTHDYVSINADYRT